MEGVVTGKTPHAPTEEPLTAAQLFDAIGPGYETAFAHVQEQVDSIQWLLGQLKEADIPRAKILDIGCGTGKPACHTLAAAGHDVLGIDVSPIMLAAAREQVPDAKFEESDIRTFEPDPETYDAVTVYFSLLAHFTQADIRRVVAKIYRVLRPGGFLVFATVPIDGESLPIKFMGYTTIASSLGPEEVVEVIKRVGFEVKHHELSRFTPKGVEAGVCKEEDVVEELHVFVYARKPAT